MYSTVCDALSEWGVRAAVSGGGSWTDHLAVKAFLDGRIHGLHLYLPTRLVAGGYDRTGGGDAGIINKYHRMFARVRGVDAFAEIQQAINKGAQVSVGCGFTDVGTVMGRDATHMLALTFGVQGSMDVDCTRGDPGYFDPSVIGMKRGVVAGRWKRAAGPEVKRHIDLNRLLGYTPAASKTDR